MTTSTTPTPGRPPLRILHLANHKSTNIGNGALIQGLERTVHEDFTHPVHFEPEAWDDYTIPDAPKRFDERFVERCNAYDALLVGAAVTLVGSEQHQHAGMRFDLPLPLWDAIRGPIVFYGLSYRTWPHQTYHHADRLRAAVEHAVASDRMLFSVRNDGTLPWMRDLLGIDGAGVREVPDPALWVPHDPEARPWILARDRVNVAVSLNDEDPERRFSAGRPGDGVSLGRRVEARLKGKRPTPGWARTRRRFVRALASALDHVAGRHDARIVLCPHHHEDFRLIADFFEQCSSRLKHQVTVVNGLPHSEQSREFYNFYREVDATLAMRVHAMSPSIGLGTPTLALCSQRRMHAFMDSAGLPDYAVDIFADDLEERVVAKVEALVGKPDEARRETVAACEAMRRQTSEFNAVVEKLIVDHARP